MMDVKDGDDDDQPRHVRIISWGKANHKRRPPASQLNVAVGHVLSYQPEGVDLKRIDGRSRSVQTHIEAQPKCRPLLEQVLKKVHKQGIAVVSVSCSRGRHRSVAFAELLAQQFRGNGYTVTVTHMDL